MPDEKIDMESMEEVLIWKNFQSSLDYFSKIDYLNFDFRRDVVDAGKTMIYARDNMVQVEKRYEYYERNKKKLSIQQLKNIKYEILELMEHIRARLEDVDYFMQKLDSFDWKEGIRKNINADSEIIEDLSKFLKVIREKYEILYETLKIRANYIKEGLIFLDLEIMIKSENKK